jgi:hypothetical protein
MSSQDRPRAEKRKKKHQSPGEVLDEKRSDRREQKHNLRVLRRRAHRTGRPQMMTKDE